MLINVKMKLLRIETAASCVLSGAYHGRKIRQNALYKASILRRVIQRQTQVQEIFINK